MRYNSVDDYNYNYKTSYEDFVFSATLEKFSKFFLAITQSITCYFLEIFTENRPFCKSALYIYMGEVSG